MKKKILLSLLALVLCVPAGILLSGAVSAQKTSTVRSSFETKKEIAYKLYGRIKIVNYGEDYTVRIASSSPDLDVCLVENSQYADRPGYWMIVENNEDFRVRFVPYSEDISIQFVDRGGGPRPSIL